MTQHIVPMCVVVELGHAAAQRVADLAEVRVLHLKGPATDRRLWHEGRPRISTDADVLVDPDRVRHYMDALQQAGWRQETDFAHGSSFEHAATLRHDVWGYLDVHRHWPGFGDDASEVFDLLWTARQRQSIGGRRCATPGLLDQRIILSINAVRDRCAPDHPDLTQAWADASAQLRSALLARVAQLDASVAFALVTGDFERYPRDGQHAIWRVAAYGGSRRAEWAARVRAAPDLRTGARTAVRALLVNPQNLQVRLGRAPSRGDLARDFVGRFARAVREELRPR
ncbi:nucleotidyltransferase family protein [Flexivirga meconopsidis]|uniref:nucleotidyltransferase family protein n=1 Tax=Flexivirga meconopsidis TaxID=2977121 RepID=UPI00223FAB45|nr:nucleotidyltransferase family protein [Flexivirga meconopsidis]